MGEGRKPIIALLALVLTVFSAAPLAAQEQSKEKVESPAISREAFFAATVASGNRTTILPSLQYWGVRGAAWGTPAADVQRIAPAMGAGGPAPAAAAAGAQPGPQCVVGGLRCDSSVDAAAGGLSKVQYRFGTGVSDRRSRLGMYRSLLSALRDAYGEPSRHVRPQENVRGEDAYVQGLDPRYEVQWQGPETNVALLLTDSELAITFTPAARSKAAVREQELNQFRQQIQSLPAGHSLKQMLE